METSNRQCWLPLVLGALATGILGWWAFYQGPASAAKLTASALDNGGAALSAAAGISGPAVALENGVFVVRGAAASDAERTAAFEAVTAALAGRAGLPGVFASFRNEITVDGAETPEPVPVPEPAPAPEPPATVADLGPQPQAEQCEEAFARTIQGRNIEFAEGSADVKSESYPLLDEIVAVAQRCATYRITVEGHTNRRGDEALNLDLSQRRATAVAEYLVSKGVSGDSLVAVGRGEAEPLDPADTEEAYARNRRIEFDVANR